MLHQMQGASVESKCRSTPNNLLPPRDHLDHLQRSAPHLPVKEREVVLATGNKDW